MLNNIALRDAAKANYKIVKREVKIIENGLAILSGEERRILELFYIQRPTDYVIRLCDELAIEKSELYRRKDKALEKFTRACFGVVSL